MNSKPFNFILTDRQKNNFAKHLLLKADGCLEWTGSKTRGGYGAVRIGNRGLVTSRIAWLIEYAADPHPLFVLHKCDNRICCNPRHLFLGTNKENQQDASLKGRKAIKLSPEIIRTIREECSSQVLSQDSIAKHFGISQGTIQRILKRQIWRHVS